MNPYQNTNPKNKQPPTPNFYSEIYIVTLYAYKNDSNKIEMSISKNFITQLTIDPQDLFKAIFPYFNIHSYKLIELTNKEKLPLEKVINTLTISPSPKLEYIQNGIKEFIQMPLVHKTKRNTKITKEETKEIIEYINKTKNPIHFQKDEYLKQSKELISLLEKYP